MATNNKIAPKTYEQALMALADVYEEYGDFRGQYRERRGALLVVSVMFGMDPGDVKADMQALVAE